MTTAQRQLYTGWGASIAFHVVVLLILATTGLFATFSQSEEKPPVDVTVYDASGAAAPAAGGDSAPAPSAPAPSVDISIPTDKEVPPDDKKQEQEDEQKQDQTPAPNQDSHASSDSHEKGSAEGSGSGQGHTEKGGTGGGGDGSAPGNGNAMKPATPPHVVAAAPPAFPPSLQGKGISGSVTLSIVVGADGSVQSASVAGSSGYPEMDAAAQQAIYNYSFEPARNSSGAPVPCRTTKTINFHGH
ncbi:energy transducer TonB [Megasphaera sp.]|uniref:energy transducer TonB n=1 Tax=Megasphaera sp. TaxID=2023260 RepID=UPI003AB00C76